MSVLRRWSLVFTRSEIADFKFFSFLLNVQRLVKTHKAHLVMKLYEVKNKELVCCTEVFFFLPDHVSIFQKVPLHQKLHPHQPVLVLHPESQRRLHQRHCPVCWREPGPLLGVDGGQISQQYSRRQADSLICCVIELPGDRDRKEERLVTNVVHSSSYCK